MSDLKRFDMNGTPHVSGQYCNAQEAADFIEKQQQRIAELEQREAEMAAHVERLREACTKAVEQVPEIACILGFAEATQMKSSTILNAVKREVAKRAIKDAAYDFAPFGGAESMHNFAEAYPAQRYPDKE